ncbi:unnamed protein product [Caenorhabditis auriculariae]|uniref:Uncharacterized protein n=1 Tax=Caenorhabditis auriculariae TaxID=2777116 RepID=A0A8S1H4E4_9PELO|nr:unnamed protein product [Caenorhabditis auriculariae]
MHLNGALLKYFSCLFPYFFREKTAKVGDEPAKLPTCCRTLDDPNTDARLKCVEQLYKRSNSEIFVY